MVVVADLVARLRREGVEETTRALSAAETQAKATGEQLDQLARKMATTSGGTVAQARQILETQGLSATQVAQALGAASTSATRLATAAQQVAAPTQAAARAAAEVHEGFNLSGASLGRFAAGVVGLGVGLSVATKLASTVHDAIGGIVDRQLEWERSLRLVSGLYGQIGPQVLETARAQVAMPGGLGSQAENVQAALNARFLTTRYGMSQSDVSDLVSTGVRVSGFLGLTEQRDREALQARMVQFAESGGSGLRELGLEGDDERTARRLGIASAAGLQGLTPQQVVGARKLILDAHLNRLAATSTDAGSLLSQRTALERGIEQMQDNIRRGLGPGGEPSAYEAMGAELTGAFPGTPYAPGGPGAIATQREQLEAMQAKVRELTGSLDSASQAADRHEAALNKLGLEANSAAVRLLTFWGSIEDPNSVTRGDIGAQQQAAITGRMRSAIPGIGTPNAEIAALSTQSAYAMAYQNYTAQLAQQSTANAYQEFLQHRATAEAGTGRDRNDRFQAAAEANTPAGRALQEAERTRPVLARMDEARRAGLQVDMQAAQQQANLEQITLRQRERGLQLMRETVDLRRLENQQQQIGIRAGMDVIRAQQAAQGPQYRLEDAQFQSTQAEVLARARMARQLQGKDVSELPSYTDLIQMNIAGQFAAAEAGPGALAGARGVQLAQRPATAAALGQQLTASQIQLGQLGVDLANLGDLPEQTALELELVQTNREQLDVQKQLRDATLELVRIMGGQPPGSTGTGGALVPDASLPPPAPSQLAGARR